MVAMIDSLIRTHPVHEVVCTVVSNDLVNEEYRHLVLDAPEEALSAQPGQFFHLLCPRIGEDAPFLRRPMSVYHVDRTHGRVEFLYKMHGKGTRAMAQLWPGDPFNIMGPLGQGFRIEDAWHHLVLVARGVGLATLAPLAQSAQERGMRLLAVCSAREPRLLMSRELFEFYGAEVVSLTDAEGTSGMENLRRILEERIAARQADAFFTCGSNRILKLLQDLSATHRIPGQIALEQQMACGLGMCFCCVRSFRVGERIDHRRVCKEGPVFDLQETLSW